MNSQYIILDYNKIYPPENINTLKWWNSHKTIYLYLNNNKSIKGSEWDNVIKKNKDIEIIIIKKEKDMIDILYEKAPYGIMVFTESEPMRIFIRSQSKIIESQFKKNYPNKNANIGLGDSELFENPIESVLYDDTFDFYWTIDNKDFEELHKEFCEKYIYSYTGINIIMY